MSWVAAAVIGGSVVGAGASIYGSGKAGDAAKDASSASIAESQRQFDLVRSDTAPIRQLGNSAVDRINRLYGYAPTTAESQQRQAGGQRFKPSEIARLKGEGLSVDDIIALGYLGGEGDKEIRYLLDQGFTSDDISRLQQGRFSESAASTTAGTGQADMSAFFESPDYQFNLAEQEKAIDRAAAAGGRYDSGAVRTQLSRNASGMASREFSNFYDRLAQQAGLGVTGIGASASAGANAASNIGAAYMNAGQQRGSAYLTGASGVNSAIQGGLGNWAVSNYLNQPVNSGWNAGP